LNEEAGRQGFLKMQVSPARKPGCRRYKSLSPLVAANAVIATGITDTFETIKVAFYFGV